MNERFDLAPWELSPDSPEKLEGVTNGQVRTNWLGEEHEFLLREVEIEPKQFVIFARETDSTEEGNWLFCNNDIPATYSSWRTRSNGAMNLFSKTQGRQLGRLFNLSLTPYGLPFNGFVLTTGGGEGHLRLIVPEDDPFKNDELLFHLPLNGLQNASSASWFESIQHELHNPNSSIRFALKWETLSYYEAASQVILCWRGDFFELMRVLRCVLSIFAPTTNVSEWIWEIGWPDKQSEWFSADNYQHPVSPEMELWREDVLGWFAPAYNEELRQKHYCVAKLIRECGQILMTKIQPPTQHERLEAALELRDWARGKVSDELLETLR